MARVGCFKRTALKHVYYLAWNRSPAQVGCMRQVLGPGALGKPRGNGWSGRWEGGLGWGTHVNPWLFHFNVWQNPPQIKKKNDWKQAIQQAIQNVHFKIIQICYRMKSIQNKKKFHSSSYLKILFFLNVITEKFCCVLFQTILKWCAYEHAMHEIIYA